MRIISHRGNLNGPNPYEENSIQQINKAISFGFDVEIDVWFQKSKFYLGHDKPKYKIDEKFLENSKFWCHAKNLQALDIMLRNSKIHCFWHEKDNFTLTSRNIIWTYPKKSICTNSVIVLNSKKTLPKNCFGICTDYPLYYLNQ